MSIRLELLVASLFTGVSVVACGGMFDKKGDAGSDAGMSASGIANEAAITRYKTDEQPVGDAVKTSRSVVAHSTYPGTDIVATLPADSAVTEVATHAGGVLVLFDQAGSKMMGWIDASAVPAMAGAVVDAAAPAHTYVHHDAGVHHDSGAPTPEPSKPKAAEKPASADGKCEAGYHGPYPKDKAMCHLECKGDAECTAAIGGSAMKCRGINGHNFCYK